MIVRRLLVGLIALLVAVQLIRNAAVQGSAETRPSQALTAWAGHPDAELTASLMAIASAARERRAVPAAVFNQVFDAASKAPLAPEPFLVRGVQAQLSGNAALAERAFLAAEWRDGRSLPARYFLADLYFRRGDSGRGLPEIAALARLAPDGAHNLAPYVAAYAKDPSTWPQLRRLFRSEPSLEDEALVVLAANSGNADTVLGLATPERKGRASRWLTPLLQSLIKDGQYGRARDVWASVSQVHADRSALIFDPGFARSEAPPPFNWALTSSTVGFAEWKRGGGLHAIFYGQEDGVLASQLLVLSPGQYRFTTVPLGTPTNSDALQWRLTCAESTTPFSSIALSGAVAGGWTFTVPAGCGAQRLELFGASADIPKQSEATIRSVGLTPERPNA